MKNPTITLTIDGSPLIREGVAGWKTEAFALDGRARGGDAEMITRHLEADAVLELELANGSRILVAAADAERYLGAAAGRGDGKRGLTITAGAALRLSGPRPPATPSRDGLGAWILKGFCIHSQGPAGMTALTAAGSFQDACLEHRNGLYRCNGERWQLTKTDSIAVSAEPTLIFIHGTASSSEGSFGGLWENAGYRKQLVAGYDSRLYAFEHRSLTVSPIANALDLIKSVPAGARLHLVSHSRGGMVGELLARANRIDQEPFTESEIAGFLQHSEQRKRQGYEEDGRRLRELNREMRSRNITIERFVRVACPARGTTLAAGKLDRWATVMFNLLGWGLDLGGKALPVLEPVANGYELLQHFLLAVVRERTDAAILPGLEAMMPDSPLVALLNGADVRLDSPLYVIAGDFQGDGLLPWLGDCLSEIYYGGESDLVVNTASMSGGAMRAQGIRQKFLAGPKVHHLSYFRREESVQSLLDVLRGDDSRFQLLEGPSRAVISRGGREIKRKDKAPLVYILPGIMGSHIQLGGNRIWFEPISLGSGEMGNLQVDAKPVTADGWLDVSYERLARYLADSHEVRPFAYDWRLSIADAAGRFAGELEEGLREAKDRGKPLRIVAHSMGGLVARLALRDKWQEFRALPGSRLLQLGTPNRGSHSIAAVLTARDDFIQLIERWFDWKHNMCEFLTIVRDFPGVLEMLPWPEDNGLASDGADYFDERFWQNLYAEDQDGKRDQSWQPPRQEPLTKALKVVQELRKAELEPGCSLYVAGHAPTPVAVRVEKGQVEIGWIDEGDGRVPWKGGIPPGVPVWYIDAAHGDLASHQPSFPAYLELLEQGATRLLSRTPAVSRGGSSVPAFRSRGLTANALYPSAEEVLAAATGGALPGQRPRSEAEAPAAIEIIHGSLAGAESPILIGAYAGEALRGSARYLNKLLDGRLERAYTIGRYPSRLEDAMMFSQADPFRKPAGAIVVGLGAIGELLPGTLTQALTHGLLEYARICEQQSSGEPSRPERLEVSSLLVGTGFIGLTVEAGTRCLLDALRRANKTLRQNHLKTRIGSLTIFEEMESRAITAVQALRDMIGETRFAGVASFDGRLRDGQGGYCGRIFAGSGQPGIYRVHIVADEGALRFTVVTDRARNVVSAEPNQRQAVDGLIRSATRTTHDQPGLSRALFELLVPNSMKDIVADLRTLMLSLDKQAAAYPWELMRDTDQSGEPPLAARVELIRQLASSHGRGRVQTVRNKRVFIVGDTQSGLAELTGAQAEARAVADSFARADYEVNDLYRASPMQVFDALFNGHYRFMHLAGHGIVNDGATGLTGMVLGPGTCLTTAQISKLRRVPECVFLNCCHLGSMESDAGMRWGELAANLATEFIEMGCKAVIAAGWAVDDQAASTFACAFYDAMFKGRRFAQAVLHARSETHRLHPLTNTWGAFQAYGDDRYRFPYVIAEGATIQEYVHPSHIIADLSMLSARLTEATEKDKKDYYFQKITAIEESARGADYQYAGVREKLAAAWAELGENERAIAHYRAALSLEDGALSLHALEQLANLEFRLGAKLLTSKKKKERQSGAAYLEEGRKRLLQLITIGPTVERLSLLGSYWKRRAQTCSVEAPGDERRNSLLEMQNAYWQAAELSHQRTGNWDYYPLLNALDGAFLSAAWGESGARDQRTAQLPDLLAAAAADGRRRYADHSDFFHALAEIETERVEALWACHDPGQAGRSLTDQKVVEKLIARYRGLLQRMGSSREQDSATYQLRFLKNQLPADEKNSGIHQALQQLIEGIGRQNE